MTQFFLALVSFLMGFSFAQIFQFYFIKIEDIQFIFLGFLLVTLFILLPLEIYLSLRKKNVREH